MKIRKIFLLSLTVIFFAVAVMYGKNTGEDPSYIKLRNSIIQKYAGEKPVHFSSWVQGVKTRIETGEKIAAITLDACGGKKKGNGYDRELINFLRENKIPATLFMTGIWIDANPELVRELASDPLFEIENHGLYHKPASVNGAKIYGRRGTKTPGELVDEIELNTIKIEKITGRRSIFYRSGTAYFDDVAVKIVYDLNHIPMNFSLVSGDAAGFSSPRIEQRLLNKTINGTVIIAHMNHPGKNLYPAMKSALLKLKARGYRFVKLQDYKNFLK
jgi:peptidoglycan/xylan/chitin deacetylase (PgdA/CDA1 family)